MHLLIGVRDIAVGNKMKIITCKTKCIFNTKEECDLVNPKLGHKKGTPYYQLICESWRSS